MYKKEISINSDVQHVWTALTQPELMKNWYFDIPGFEAIEGKTFDFVVSFEDEGAMHHFRHVFRILEVIPYQKLKHTWEHPGHSKGSSTLTWELFPEKDSTSLILTHEGNESFINEGSKYFTEASYTAGWNAILDGLKNYLESKA